MPGRRIMNRKSVLLSVFVCVFLFILWSLNSVNEKANADIIALSTVDSFDWPITNESRPSIGYDVTPAFGRGTPTACYGVNWENLYHAGVDSFAPAGTSVKAIANGVIKYVKNNANYDGAVVIIEHTLPDGQLIYSMYGHLIPPIPIGVATPVTKGAEIGRLIYQEYGRLDNTHLHWEIRNFLDASFICPQGGNTIHGPGYTYPNHPDYFPNEPGFPRYFNPTAFFYEQQRNHISTVLIIDATGSMLNNDPLGMRKQAAKAFVDTAEFGDKIAIVAFNENAYSLASLTTIESIIDKNNLKVAIDQVTSTGGTDLNSGLNRGFQELLQDTSANKKAAIFLTDGRHNDGVYDPQSHQQYQQQMWPIYAIGLGNEVDTAFLTNIAKEYFPLTDSNQLPPVYFELSEELNDGKIFHSKTILATPNGTQQLLINIPKGQSQATFYMSWSEANTPFIMSLTSPGGREIYPTISGGDINHIIGETYEMYVISYPESGNWTMEISSFIPIDQHFTNNTIPIDVRVSARGIKHLYLPLFCINCNSETLTPTTPTPTQIPNSTPIPTFTYTSTPIPSPSNTSTPTPSPSNTSTSTPTPSPSNTSTPTPSPSNTSTSTPTPSPTNTPTLTPTPTSTPLPPPPAPTELLGPYTNNGGFELGNMNGWVTLNGTVDVNSDFVRSGSYSVHGSSGGDESEGEPPVTFHRDISLDAYEIWIDAGLAVADYEAWLHNGNSEHYKFIVRFFSESGTQLGVFDTGWIRNPGGGYHQHGAQQIIPTGTSFVRIGAEMKRNAGSYTDVDIDDISFIISFNNP